MSPALDDVPLRDLCKEAERLTRELIDHLERNQIPKTRELATLVRPDSPLAPPGQIVPDVAVRTQAATLIDSQDFAAEVFEKASEYFAAIDRAMNAMVAKKPNE